MKFNDWYLKRQITEVRQDVVDKVTAWIGEKDKPFNNLFGDKWRFIIPLRDPRMLEIKSELEAAGYKVDLNSGKAYKDVKTQRGTSRREQNIGRIIRQLMHTTGDFDKADLDWWSSVASQKDKTESDNYKIIMSRHPIDIVRMSDHGNIKSCHSQSGSYFKCAVEEAMGNAPIAYLVKAKDISDKDDKWLQQDNIFEDKDRSVSGINPVARLRLRRYIHKEDEYELALPEERTYGHDKSGFLDSVLDWSRESQKEILEAEPDLDEFRRTGGSYQDNSDGDLFNQFFNTNQYGFDNADYESESEDDFESMADNWEREAEELQAKYNQKLKHCGVMFSIGEMDDGRPYMTYDAQVQVKFPGDLFKEIDKINFWEFFQSSDWDDTKKARAIEKNIIDNLKNMNSTWSDSFLTELNVEEEDDYINLTWNVVDSDGDVEGPDGFEYFCKEVESEIDDKFDMFRAGITNAFVKMGYMESNVLNRFRDEVAKTNFEFKHFSQTSLGRPSWQKPGEFDEEFDLGAWIKLGRINDIKMPNLGFKKRIGSEETELEKFPGFDEFYKIFFNKLLQIERAKLAMDARQKRIPGMGMNKPAMPIQADVVKPKLQFRLGWERAVWVGLRYVLPQGSKESKKRNTLQLIKYIDDNYEHVVETARRVFELTVRRKFAASNWKDMSKKVVNKIDPNSLSYGADSRELPPFYDMEDDPRGM